MEFLWTTPPIFGTAAVTLGIGPHCSICVSFSLGRCRRCVRVACSNLVHKMPLGQIFMEQFEFADVFNHLGLNDTETGLICAVMIFNPGMINRRVFGATAL